jgi:DNA (cytosine-5)-methyltransferase 1
MYDESIVPIIDLFAGPGGLGEGFSQFSDDQIKFKIALSIEMNTAAHRTLELRAFVRQFNSPPAGYYDYLNGVIDREALFDAYPSEAEAAREEAWCHELKQDNLEKVKLRAKNALKKFSSKECVMIGGPPCQAYSTAGRSRMKSTRENFDDDPRHFLYRHYLRMVAHIKPAVFVMENVKGLKSARVHGKLIFPQIMDELSRPGEVVKDIDGLTRAPSKSEYHLYSLVKVESKDKDLAGDKVQPLTPDDYVIRSEDYGIPQKRHRIILLGVRKDIDPVLAKRLVKSKLPVSVDNVLQGLPVVRSHVTKRENSWQEWVAVMQEGLNSGEFNSVDEKTLKKIKLVIESHNHELTIGGLRYDASQLSPERLARWYRKDTAKIKVVLNHETKRHKVSDIWRYLFLSCFATVHGRTPTLRDFPDNLLPDHKNVTAKNKKNVDFVDRFKVQVGDKPATTVTSHLSKDGHYFIHNDPSQCRAWTCREAARIQTFPDNYFFEGTKTEQYHQVGNAVPPRLAWQIADVVAEHMKVILDMNTRR